jgi:hypothetical protein
MTGTGPATLACVLLAHQGGWDEILFVAVPIAVFAGLLALANRRAGREQQAAETHDGPHEPRDEPTPDT